MIVENTGVMALEWTVNFPNDSDITIEKWAKAKEYTEEQIQQNFILDNQIFTVTPKVRFKFNDVSLVTWRQQSR